ncbi:MAG: polysaccharide biosynthesis protein PslG [Actinomycetota bacterium]
MRIVRNVVALLVAVVCLALPALKSGTAQAATTRTDGVVADLTWYISHADMDRSVAMMATAGVKTVRANINWSSLEPTTKGQIDAWWLGEIDYAVAKLNSAGIQVLMPIADGVPYWASADPARYQDGSGNHWNNLWKPRLMQDYADFAQTIVRRYSAQGVHAYEVWNEPNYSHFWPSGPSAADYTTMLRAAYPAIKSADPSATVLMGGLSRNDYTFLQAMYAAGARPYFDAAAVHPYTGAIDPTVCWNASGSTMRAIDAFCAIESVRTVMVNNGDSAKNLWLTEFGWSTATATSNGVTEAVQADYLTKAFKWLDQYPYVTHAYWYAGRNLYWGNNNQSDIESNYGLVRVDFSTKPSYDSFKSLHGATAPTTTTTAPPVTTTTPTTAPPVTTPTTVAGGDVTAPVLSGIRVANLTQTSGRVYWTTNESSDSYVEYWVTGGAVKSTSSATRVLNHSLSLSFLTRITTYNYRVKSKDAAGNLVTSAVYTFTTKA